MSAKFHALPMSQTNAKTHVSGMRRLYTITCVLSVLLAAWMWDFAGTLKWAQQEHLYLEGCWEEGVSFSNEEGAIIEFQYAGKECNEREPIVVHEGSEVVWRPEGLTIASRDGSWMVSYKGEVCHLAQHVGNERNEPQRYRVFLEGDSLRVTTGRETYHYTVSPNAISWLIQIGWQYERYTRAWRILWEAPQYVIRCLLLVVLLFPFRKQLWAAWALVLPPSIGDEGWQKLHIGDQTVLWQSEHLAWWKRALGARMSCVWMKVSASKRVIGSTRTPEWRALLWCVKNGQTEEAALLWEKLKPTLLPAEASLWQKLTFAWHAAKEQSMSNQNSAMAPPNKKWGRCPCAVIPVICYMLPVLALGNLVYEVYHSGRERTEQEQRRGLWLTYEKYGPLLVDQGSQYTEYTRLLLSENTCVSWLGIQIHARRGEFFMSKASAGDSTSISDLKEQENVMTILTVDRDGSTKIRKTELSDSFEVPSRSMEMYRLHSEAFWEGEGKNMAIYLLKQVLWLCVAIVVLLSPLREVLLSIISIITLPEAPVAPRKRSAWQDIFRIRKRYRLISIPQGKMI